METTPLPTSTTLAVPITWVTHYIAWIKAHERILVFGVSAFLLFRVGQGIENIILKHDAKTATVAAATVMQDTASNKALADQLANMKAAVDAQTAKITASIAASKTALAAQQKKDAASTPTEIDARWQGLLPLNPGSITPLTSDTTSVANDAANQTVQALEEIPTLKSNIAYLTQEVNDRGEELFKQNDLITGLNTQIADERKKDIADVKIEKDKAKHQFWRGFKVGVVVGAVGIEAVRIWAGHP